MAGQRKLFALWLVALLVAVAGAALPPPVVTSRVSCATTKGDILLEIYRDWAPLGADRFLELVRDGFFSDIAFFRCVKGFLTQFGISDKTKYKHWHNKNIPDDPMLHIPIRKNYLSYAGGGPNTRSTQLFIAFEDLDFLGKEPWETPFGAVVEGQATLDALYKEYGDIPPFGHGPDQQKIHNRGNDYVRADFPHTDFLLSCREVVTEAAEAGERRELEAEEEEEEEEEEGGGEEEGREGGVEEGEEEGEGEEGEELADAEEQGEETGEEGGEEEEEGEAGEEGGEEGEGQEERGEEEQGEGEEEEEEEKGEEGSESKLLGGEYSSPPAVTLLAVGLFLGITITYCSIRRNKVVAAEGKAN